MHSWEYNSSSYRLPLWASLISAIIGALLLVLSFPSAAIWPLVFPAMIFFFASLIGRSLWSAALVGTVFGAAFYLVHMTWLLGYLGPVPWLALSILQALFITGAAVLIVLAQRLLNKLSLGNYLNWALTAVIASVIWTAQEIISGAWPYTGFPWARLGASQSNSPLAEIVSFGGISLLSFVIALISASVTGIIFAKNVSPWKSAIVPLSLVVLLAIIPQAATAQIGSLKVGSVQGDGPSAYFDQRERGDVLRAQLDTSMELFGEKMDLVVWPEGGVDSDPLINKGTALSLDVLAKNLDAPLLINAATNRDGLIWNTSMIWEPDEPVTQLHDKVNPVPFGEYVPDRWFFEMLAPDLVGLIQREYSPGQNEPYLEFTSKADQLIGVGLAICFDVLYDDVIHRSINAGAEFLVFQTNNADFRGTEESLQQLAVARLRAIETGRTVINISTIGTSQVITSTGQIISEIPADTAGVMYNEIELRNGITPAVVTAGVIENLLLWAMLISFALLLVVPAVKARYNRSKR